MRCPSYDRLYPVNTLRNRALRRARASLVFLLDVDFVPSNGLHARLCSGDMGQRLHRTLLSEGAASPVALVVPAFEIGSGDVPRDAADLRLEYEAGNAKGFHLRNFPKGHRATCFDRWFAGAADFPDAALGLRAEAHGLDTYAVEYEENFEPYVVMARAAVPEYDERFRGYGLNKISHLYSVNAKGVAFHVIDHIDAFVVAKEHPKSESWRLMYGPAADAEHRARLAAHFAEFKAGCRAARPSQDGGDFAKRSSSACSLKMAPAVDLPSQVGRLVEVLAARRARLAREVAQAA